MHNSNLSTSYVPECPCIELNKVVTDVDVINALKMLSYDFDVLDKSTRNLHIDTIAERKEKFLASLFEVESANCYLSETEFTLYAGNLEEASRIKAKVNLFGFKNVQTFAAKWDEMYTGTKFKYGVNVNQRTSLRFGKPELSLENILTRMLPKFFNLIEDYTIFTYSYHHDYRITLNDKNVALLALENINKILEDLSNYSRKKCGEAFNLTCVTDYKIDTVDIKFILTSQ